MKTIKEKERFFKGYVLKPITKLERKAYRFIHAYHCKTAYDVKRLVEMIRLYNRAVTLTRLGLKEDSAILGYVVELGTHRPTSTITRVRTEKFNDSYILVDDKPHKLEVKTNGGHIEELMKKSAREKESTYIFYYLDMDVRPSKYNPSGLRRLSFVCTLGYFLEVLETYNAYKPNPTRDNKHTKAYNIQADSKKMYEHFKTDLESGKIIPFNREMVYISEDFED